MTWKNRRVFITGAGGFIGSHLTESLLQAGAQVTALVHYNSSNRWSHLEPYYEKRTERLTVLPGDIRDKGFMRQAIDGHDTVFHLAALIAIPYSYRAPESFVQTNVQGTLNVLEASLAAGVRGFVHTSTSEVYGTARYVPIDEAHPLQGQSPYSASKIAADQLAYSFYTSFDLPVVTIRPFNTFGPRQSARAIIPTILSSLLGQSKQLHLGDLTPVRDFTYVLDTVRGFMLAGARVPKGETINLGSGHGISINDLVKACAGVLGVPVPTLKKERQRIRPQRSEVWRLIAAHQKARKFLGWKPQFSFEEGLGETAAYIRDHLSEYKGRVYNV